MIDLRRIRVGIEIRGRVHFYEGLRVHVTGTKYSSDQQNECTVVIDGLNEETRNFLLTETSPFNENRTPKRLIVEAGRVSTGLFNVYTGDITGAEVGSPPDVTMTLRAKTNNANNGQVVTYTGRALMKLSEIARQVATSNGVRLEFEATDKNIANYSFSGVAARQIGDLQRAGDVKAYVDDLALFVRDRFTPVRSRVRVLNVNSGMVGLPKPTEDGVEVTYLVDGESDLGGRLRLESRMNQTLNGDYIINQLQFDLASHADSFFYKASCERI